MANKVSFIIKLKDQFGGTAAKIKRQFTGIKDAANRASKGVVKFARTIKKSMGDVGRSMVKTGAVMTAAVTLPIALMAKSMIDAASDAVETANKFNAVFDDVEGKANKVADTFAKSFGTAKSTARDLIGSTGDLLVGFGFTGDRALELSKKVNELAADLTSFQNVEGGVQSASNALTKAILGETESAKSLGIVIRQLDPAFKKQVRILMRSQNLTEQQAKAIVILNQAAAQSRKAIGDVSRTWEDYASVVRRSEERTKEMKESFGRLLLPIATIIISKITKLVNWMNTLSPAMKKLILIVSGVAAVAGPLLVIIGGMAIAFAALSAPVLIIIAAIAALTIASGALAVFWDDMLAAGSKAWASFAAEVTDVATLISTTFDNVWTGVLSGLINFVNVGIGWINKLLIPINALASTIGIDAINVSAIQAPQAPIAGASGSINGNIVVSATPGAVVDSTSMASRGVGLNMGVNMVTQ